MGATLQVIANSCLTDASGTLITSGTAEFLATNMRDVPIPFRIGTALQATLTPVRKTITAGSIVEFPIANPAESLPTNVRFRITVTDSASNKQTVYRKVLIVDTGGGQWNMGAANLTPDLATALVELRTGATGTPGAPGTIGKTNQAASTADFSQVNPANLLPSGNTLGQGTTLFDNGNEFCGDDLGHNLGTYHKRSFSSTGLPAAHVFAPSGSRPTGDNSFTQAGWYLAPNIYNLFPDIGNGLSNPKHSFTRDGDAYHSRNLSVAGDFHSTNASFSGLITCRSFQSYPNGGISSNDFISCNSAGNLPNPSTGYGGGYALWKDSNGNTKAFLDFNCSDYGPRIAMQPGWKFHFATVGTGSTNANDCSDFAYMTSAAFVFGPLSIDMSGNITTPGNISAGISAAGDAITATQFAPLYQLKTDATSRTYAPSSYQMPWSGYIYAAYGDSITYGLYTSNPATKSYPALVAAALGATLDNQGVSSDIALDTTFRVFNHENPSTTSKRRYSVAIGTNDSHIPTGIIDWKPYHLAILAWLGTVAEDRVDGHVATAANWSDDTTYAAVTGKTCSTAGAAIAYTVQTYGKPLYLWYQTRQGNGTFGTGAFTVKVDGGVPLAVNSFPDGGQPGQTGGIGVKLLRIAVAAGTHTVTITSTSSGVSTIVSLGTPARHSYYDSPCVAVGGVIPERNNRDTRGISYTDWAMDNVLLLQSDGLDIRAVANRAPMQNGLAALYADDLHPNDPGHAAEALPYLSVLQRPPDTRYVSRWTPRSSASVGTPGDVWSDDSYVYGVKAAGVLFRLAAGSW